MLKGVLGSSKLMSKVLKWVHSKFVCTHQLFLFILFYELSLAKKRINVFSQHFDILNWKHIFSSIYVLSKFIMKSLVESSWVKWRKFVHQIAPSCIITLFCQILHFLLKVIFQIFKMRAIVRMKGIEAKFDLTNMKLMAS